MDPVTTYRKTAASHKFTFVVFYRGSWCPFCMSYLKTLESLRTSIEASSGAVIIITAQDPSFVAVTRERSGYQGEIIVDRELKIATELRERGLLNVAVSTKDGYPNGMTQPAVLVITEKGEVLYRWEIVPSTVSSVHLSVSQLRRHANWRCR
jgi:peroxiredoxin